MQGSQETQENKLTYPGSMITMMELRSQCPFQAPDPPPKGFNCIVGTSCLRGRARAAPIGVTPSSYLGPIDQVFPDDSSSHSLPLSSGLGPQNSGLIELTSGRSFRFNRKSDLKQDVSTNLESTLPNSALYFGRPKPLRWFFPGPPVLFTYSHSCNRSQLAKSHKAKWHSFFVVLAWV